MSASVTLNRCKIHANTISILFGSHIPFKLLDIVIVIIIPYSARLKVGHRF